MGCPGLPQRSANGWCGIIALVILFQIGAGLVVGLSVAISMTDMTKHKEGTISQTEENHKGFLGAAIAGYIAAAICLFAVVLINEAHDNIMQITLRGAFICYLPYSIPVAAVIGVAYICMLPAWLVRGCAQWCAKRPARKLERGEAKAAERKAATRRIILAETAVAELAKYNLRRDTDAGRSAVAAATVAAFVVGDIETPPVGAPPVLSLPVASAPPEYPREQPPPRYDA